MSEKDRVMIGMKELNNEQLSVLAGAPDGRVAFTKLLMAVAKEPNCPKPVYINFVGVEIATASYLRESVLQFHYTVRRQRSNWYPIIANANMQVLEELTLLTQVSNSTLIACKLNAREQPTELTLLGSLDPKQKLTFDLVNQRGETDASELMREYGVSESVKQTAWNNRLVALAGMGLIFELSQGRTKRYKALFEGAIYGH